MKNSVGDPEFPVWLVADSEPMSWQELLLTPLDPRHPARHSIWTSVLEYMQEALYRQDRRRFATDRLYIINAIKDPDDKPKAMDVDWPDDLRKKTYSLRDRLLNFKPKVILTFGASAFEFVRRAYGNELPLPYGKWSTKRLGEEFRKRIALYNPSGINVLPLLHVSISRGRFLESHRYFVGEGGKEPANYFEFVGTKLANLFLKEAEKLPIWITSGTKHCSDMRDY